MEHLVFILSGFATVMTVLALLWAVLALIGRAFVAHAGRAARVAHAGDAARAAAPAAPSPSPASATAAPGVPPHHLVAIAAAVAEITGGRGRVVRVHAAAHQSTAWARHGRIEQFAGHRVRWGWSHTAPNTTR